MKIEPIDGLAGEHVIAVHPDNAEDASLHWKRRLNLFTGRALTAPALAMEQAGRDGRFAIRGQARSSGVLAGLECALETADERALDATGVPTTARRHYLRLAPGFALAASGEDVRVPFEARVNLADLPVQAPSALGFGGGAAPAPGPEDGEDTGPRARRMWGSLGQLLEAGAELPRAGILILQPTTVEAIGGLEDDDPCGPGSSDPCEVDPAAYAFEDWQLIDGCRLVWMAWPTEVVPLPAEDGTWRNRLAHALFDFAGRLPAGSPAPWETLGVPIGLLAFSESATAAGAGPRFELGELPWSPQFLDQHSVLRQGGRPLVRTRPPGLEANPYLWQARFRQFAEHMTDLSTDPSTTLAQSAASFRFLPPIGMLPPEAIDARRGQTDFFPANYFVDAAPVPTEQLDLLVRESAALTPFDLSVPDRIRVYVPVPQIWYEPDLLRVEAVSPEFEAAIDDYTTRRGRWLARRDDVRSKVSTLHSAITGTPFGFPSPDPGQVDDPEPRFDPVDPEEPALAKPEGTLGTELDAAGIRRATALDDLRSTLERGTPVRSKVRVSFTGNAPTLAALSPDLTGRLTLDATEKTLTLKGRLESKDRAALLGLSQAQGWTKAVDGLQKRSLEQEELSRLDALGLVEFIRFLEAKITRANDKVDVGFVRVQTDIYRIRQHILGSEAATRLATSPALAQIAQGESAKATQESLRDFVGRLGLSDAQDASPAGSPGGGGAGTTSTTAPGTAGTTTAGATTAGRTAAGVGVASVSRSAISLGGASTIARTTSARLPSTGGATTVFATGGGRAAFSGATVVTGRSTGLGTTVGSTVSGGTGRPGASSGIFGRGLSTSDQVLEASTQIRTAGLPRKEEYDRVTQQAPIVGKTANFRTVSVAERLQSPPALESKSFSVAGKFTVLSELAGLDLNIDDLEVPGFYAYASGQGDPILEDVPDPRNPQAPPIKKPREVLHSFGHLRDSSVLAEVLFDRHDFDPSDGDEAGFFGASIRTIDHTIAALRLIEGRIEAYRRALELCKATLRTLEDQRASAIGRLGLIDDQVAEARHDVSVARALLAEERQRVDDINERRDRIIADHVEFVVFQRVRQTDLIRDMPARSLRSGLIPAPVPACLRHTPVVPDELRTLLESIEDAPIRWFPEVRRLLDRLDTRDSLFRALEAGKRRAAQGLLLASTSPLGQITASARSAPFGLRVQGLIESRKAVLTQSRRPTAELDLTPLVHASWTAVRDQTAELTSVGDLLEARSANANVRRAAARTLDEIATVAGCLYEGFGTVAPRLRLAWAERVSQFDEGVSLRNLGSLPEWGDVDAEDRRTLQALVDWLFGRVDHTSLDALDLINDVVQLALLLASHAPVDRILTGQVDRDTTVGPKGHVRLKADLSRVRVGMAVHLFKGDAVVARAIVDDLSGELASARIVHTERPSLQLPSGARVRFIDPERAEPPSTQGSAWPFGLGPR